ncbi:MAG: DNA-protecting protein DprA [Lewinellaceae bacterium]|nr:DNA-processing protein DprA [Saprospiraceae bacterium]MCB9308351.1 DNA-protecting protein DprA [Lewinellaceae bacterium]MCB9356812.1 DNA-protecting protein DprA [Lewinellaceae bacterium]
MPDKLQYQIALTLVPQVGAITAKTLVSYCGSAEAVLLASRKELLKIPGIGPVTADSIRSAEVLRAAEREIAFLEQHGIDAIFYTDERYPARLRQCYDCPPLLYFKGSDTGLLSAQRIIAVVGTRQPSEYGKAICEEIVEGLQAFGALVVSGLAFGIDITAHRKATALGMPNIGVLGHGLANIYPSQHRSIALKMIEQGGLLTEYPHDTQPDREHFPMRNRIIAGLCDALLVVETAATGGSMISAGLADQYGRETFAVPGRVRDAKSTGCNLLVKNNRARLVESASDIATVMRWEETGRQTGIQPQLFPDLSPAESQLIAIIRAQPEIPIDQLTLASRLSPGELASLILELEFKGVIRTLPGKRYMVSA